MFDDNIVYMAHKHETVESQQFQARIFLMFN